MSREYPAFIIDRSRRSEASRFSDDFVVCPDKEVGFIARVYKLPKSRRGEFEKSLEGLTESEIDNRYIFAAVDDVIRMAESQRERLEDMNGKAVSDRFINALRSARESVELLQKITKHE